MRIVSGPARSARRRLDVLGIPIDPLTMEDVLARFQELILHGGPAVAVSVNVDIWTQLRRSPSLREVWRRADLVLVDGTPLVMAARILGKPLPGRVSGSDLLPRFCALAAKKGYRVFFLGAGPGVAERAKRVLESRYQGLNVVGTYAPPLLFERDPIENERTIENVRRSAPDALFVALGTPRQELWLHHHSKELAVPISMGIGSGFDYVAGRLRRAPPIMQRLALEWVWRLLQEPRRLWRRYLVDDLPFVWFVARERIRMALVNGRSRDGHV